MLGITKAYTTRVGHGPFPTELDGDTIEGRLSVDKVVDTAIAEARDRSPMETFLDLALDADQISRVLKNVIGNASVLQYNEITAENVASFHFHGDPAAYPITAVIALPRDQKAGAILRGRHVAAGVETDVLSGQITVPMSRPSSTAPSGRAANPRCMSTSAARTDGMAATTDAASPMSRATNEKGNWRVTPGCTRMPCRLRASRRAWS